HLRARAATDQEAEAQLAELGDKIELALGEHVYSTKGESLEEVVGMYLVMRQKTLAVAESCTGGLLSERLTGISGSSSYFLGGAVCYTNEMKTRWAGVPVELIQAHGAVSKPVAQALAEGVRARAGASIGVGHRSESSIFPAHATACATGPRRWPWKWCGGEFEIKDGLGTRDTTFALGA